MLSDMTTAVNHIPAGWAQAGYRVRRIERTLTPGFLFTPFLAYISALAMRPLGHIAGIGATVVTSLPTMVSVPFGAFVGYSFDGTLNSLTAAYALCGVAAFAAMRWADSGRDAQAGRVL